MAAKEAARPARSVAADKFLSSPEFRSVVQQASGKKLPEAAQKTKDAIMDRRLLNSASWKELYRTMTKEEKESVSRVGVIGWLSGEEG